MFLNNAHKALERRLKRNATNISTMRYYQFHVSLNNRRDNSLTNSNTENVENSVINVDFVREVQISQVSTIIQDLM